VKTFIPTLFIVVLGVATIAATQGLSPSAGSDPSQIDGVPRGRQT
jgi:hypothetical protein